MITGTVVSGLLLGTASVLTGIPGTGAPEAETVEVTPGSGFDLRREDAEAELPEVERSPEAAGAPQVAPPAPDDLSSIGSVGTAPPGPPETGVAEELSAAPAASGETPGIEVETESPVLLAPSGGALQPPSGETRLSVGTAPTQPPPTAPETDAETEAETSPETGPETETATGPEPDPVTEPESEPEPAAPDSAETGGTGSAQPVFPAEEPAPVPLPDAGADAGIAVPQTNPEPTQPPDPQTPPETAEAPADTAESRTRPSAGTIGDLAEGVTTDRLPRVTDAPAPTAEAETPAPVGALERNAVAFEPPEDKPLMAIVLMDDGTSPIGPEALQSFPYPLNFAVDIGAPGAAEAAARYREAGFEVLVMGDLPPGARPADAEVALQDWFDRVPQAVAVLEGTGTGLQSSREASAQLVPILKESGHGLVMHPNGLNTAQKLIAREGVPSASLLRDFDGEGQEAAVIRRLLDQAMLRAGQQQEGVIMLGRLRAETISALLLWGLQDRAASVALAPVSAVLQQQ